MNFLDKVQLAYTCPLAWEKLVGGESRRFCGDCQKHVTNLSAMSRPAAEAWLRHNQGASICVRVEVDAAGRAVHRPTFRASALAALAIGAAGCPTDEDSGLDSAVVDVDALVVADGAGPAGRTTEDAERLIPELSAVEAVSDPALRPDALASYTRKNAHREYRFGQSAAVPVPDTSATLAVLGEPPAIRMGTMPAPVDPPEPPRPLMGKPAMRPLDGE
jgi:hypothetical protein